MDIEKVTAILRRARLAEKDTDKHEVLKVLIEMAHEVSIARSEIALLTLRVERLENDKA